MARGFPPKSAYLGSDLPPEDLVIPAGSPPDIGMPDVTAPPGRMSGPQGSSGDPMDRPPDGPSDWVPALSRALQKAGIDPAIIAQGPGDKPSEWLAAIEPLKNHIATDSEIDAFEAMLDEYGLMGQNIGEGAYHQGHSGPGQHTSGKPGAAADPRFTPDLPSGDLRKRY